MTSKNLKRYINDLTLFIILVKSQSAMELEYIFAYILGIVTVAYFVFKHKFSYWKRRGVPYLEPTIPYGNLSIGGRRSHVSVVFNELYFKLKHLGKFCGVYFSISPIAVITDLDLVRDILIKDFNNFHDRGLYYNERDDPLSGNMFFVEGAKWKRLRNALSPTFTSGKMKFMYSTVKEVADRFVITLNEKVKENNVVEIKDLLARYSTDIIGSCAFGIECNSLKDPKAQFRKAGCKFFAEPRHGKLAQRLIDTFTKFSRYLGIKIVQDDVSEFFMGVVRETVAFREKNKIRRNDFMDLLIELKNGKNSEEKLTFEEIAAQAFVFFLAGFETSSSTMSYALYELCLNQDIQDKAREEINRVLEKHNGELSYDAISEMTYVDNIISESLRKYPPVFIIQRIAINDYHVSGTDKVIEKGTQVTIPAISIQNDPDIYPEPEKFNPDRFNPEEVKKRHPTAFLSFGEGPRNCIGLRFGRMQSRVGLISLLKNFKVSPCSETMIPLKYDPDGLVLIIDGGLYMKIEKI